MSQSKVKSGSIIGAGDRVAPYDAMVYKDGTYTIAVDGDGNVIKKVLSSLNTDEVIINAAISYVGINGTIEVSGGTYVLSDQISGFYAGTGTSDSRGIIFNGDGNSTVFEFNIADKFALAIEYESAINAKVISNCVFSNFKISCGSSVNTGGGISLKAVTNIKIENVQVIGTSYNGTGIKLSENTYGSGCITNSLSKVYVSNFNYGVYLDNHTQIYIRDWSNIVYCVTPIYATAPIGSSLLYISHSQIRAEPTGGYAINTSGFVQTAGYSLYNDGGLILHDGGEHNYINCNIPVPSYTAGTRVFIGGETSDFNGTGNNIDSMMLWPSMINGRYIIEAQDPKVDAAYGVLVDDVLASGGKCRQNITPTEKGYAFFRSFASSNHGFLPRGKYAIIIRAKDTDNVVNDCKILVWNYSDATYPIIKLITLTSNYEEYMDVFTIDSDDASDNLRIAIYKNTTTSNTISIDYIELVYLCSEWGDPQIRMPHYYIRSGESATITASNTYVDVAHGLPASASKVRVTPTTNLGTRSFWVDTKGASTFRININSSDIIDHTFDWEAEV